MVNDYVPTNPCPTRVYVNGTRVPAEDVDVHLRKEGPLDINRYAEINFASPFNGKDFLSTFNSIKEESTTPDTLRIEARNQTGDSDTEGYETLFNGVVTGVGDSPSSNRKIHQCRAQGPEHYLAKIPASIKFKSVFKAAEIFGYVAEELNKNFALDISTDAIDTGQFTGRSGTTGGGTGVLLFNTLTGGAFKTSKTFTANKHLLADVVDWANDKLDGRTWIQPTQDGGEFIFASSITSQSQTHKAHYLSDGNTRIINNTALKEIKPLNTVTLNGRAAETLGEVGDFELNIPSSNFYQVKARHKTLYQRNGQKELSDTIRKSDSETKQEVAEEAKSILKRRIDEATSGSMRVVHDSFIQPFDTVEARPTVNTQSNPVDPIEYEIHRCHYKCRPSEPGTIDHVDLNCGIQTDIDEDIEIISSARKEA